MPWLLPSRHLATGLACDKVNLHLPPKGQVVVTFFFPLGFCKHWGRAKTFSSREINPINCTGGIVILPCSWGWEIALSSHMVAIPRGHLPPQSPPGSTALLQGSEASRGKLQSQIQTLLCQKHPNHHPKTQQRLLNLSLRSLG